MPSSSACSTSPGWKRDPAERDRDVHGTRAGLAALARVGAQRLDAEAEPGQRGAVPDRAVYHQAGPAVLRGGPGQHVADQGGVQRAAAVHHQHAARTGGPDQVAEQAVVFVAGHRAHRPGEHALPAELAELHVTDAQFRPVLIGQVRRGSGVTGHRVSSPT